MISFTQKQQNVINIALKSKTLSSSEIHAELLKKDIKISLVTVKRLLTEMVEIGALIILGSGPATVYMTSPLGRIFSKINTKEYCSIEPDKRYGLERFNFDLLSAMPDDIFLPEETTILNEATKEYKKRTTDISETIQKKELARLIIELSWKSSRIEGNTYTLLDTEKLILENKEAIGHNKNEACMILNHKDAFNFAHENASQFENLTSANLEKLHAILVKDLNIDTGFREKPVGVLGSKYQPLDNIYQIKEAVLVLSNTIKKTPSPYAKALLALLGISYIQPFEDGNKRTSRLMANALLMAHGLAPLSYRSVDENEYREVMLVFYEINSIIPFKKIFIEQYVFAAKNYAVK